MAFTKKIAGWVAGRIKGEQARKDTMRWMEKTGLGQILDIAGDIALTQGAIKGVSGLKGLMTGQKAATAAQTAATATTAKALPEGVTEVGRLASASPAESRALVGQMMAPKPMPPLPAPGAGATTFAPRTATAIGAPPPVTGMPGATPMRAMVAPPAAAPAPVGGMTPSMTRTAGRLGGMENVANANVTQGPSFLSKAAAFGRENASWVGPAATATGKVVGEYIKGSAQEEQMRREQEARNRLAMLLMPMFQAQIGQAAPTFQPRG